MLEPLLRSYALLTTWACYPMHSNYTRTYTRARGLNQTEIHALPAA